MEQFVLDDDNLYGNNALTDRQTSNSARENRGGKACPPIVCRDESRVLW